MKMFALAASVTIGALGGIIGAVTAAILFCTIGFIHEIMTYEGPNASRS